MLADRVDQRIGGNLFGTVQCNRLARGGRGRFDSFGAIALSQYQSVIECLRATGATGGPGDPAVAVLLVDADAVVVGDEAFVEADELLVQRRNEQLCLDRHAAAGTEFDFGIQTPDIVGFILAYGNVEYIYLIASNQQAQTDHQGDEDF